MTDTTTYDGFPCDELLTSQWQDRQLPCFTDVPERRLLIAVLLDAVRCLQLGVRQRTEVLAWIRGDYLTARIPFRSLCDGLELEPAPLARRLLLPAIPGPTRHRRVGVRRMCEGGMRIVVVERPTKRGVKAAPAAITAEKLSA
jgi:hypothetical protein